MSLNPTQQEVDQRIDQTLDQSVEATRRILQTAQQTETVGIETANKLAEQGDQLDKIEGQQKKIEKSVVRNKSQLSALEKCCGVFRDKKKLNRMNEETYRKSSESPQNVKPDENKPTVAVTSTPQQPNVRITDDAREDEIASNLGAVNGIVGNLKSLALGMSNELDKQNEQLDRINEQTEKNSADIHNLDRRTRKLLNQKVSVDEPQTSSTAAKVAKAVL